MRDVTVGAVQFEHAAENKRVNLEKIQRFVQKASEQSAEIIVFPECCITGCWFLRRLASTELRTLAEPVQSGLSSQALLSMAREFGMTIGAGLVELDAQGKLHNTYVIAMPDGKWQLHRKIHAFEHEEIVPGAEFTVFDTPHGCRVGVWGRDAGAIGEAAQGKLWLPTAEIKDWPDPGTPGRQWG